MREKVKIADYWSLVEYLLKKGYKNDLHEFETPEFRLISCLFGAKNTQKSIENIFVARKIIDMIKEYERLGVPKQYWFNKFLSSIELKIADILYKENILFISQMPISEILPIKKIRFTVDFYLPKQDVSIEVDGSYWHSLPNKINWDKRKEALFGKYNKRILHITEKEVNTSLEYCKNKILSFISSR